MAIRVLLPQPILPAGYEYLREHGYEVVDGRGFTEELSLIHILPSIGIHSGKVVQSRALGGLEGGFDSDLASRHGKGVLAVTLVGYLYGIAVLVSDRQLIQLIACLLYTSRSRGGSTEPTGSRYSPASCCLWSGPASSPPPSMCSSTLGTSSSTPCGW